MRARGIGLLDLPAAAEYRRNRHPASARDLVAAAAAAIRRSPFTGLLRARDAEADACDLYTHAVGRPFRDTDRPTPAERRRFQRLVARRVAGEPVALILGGVEFFGLWLSVVPGTFAPRSSSEGLAQAAIRRLRRRQAPIAVDVATGVGPVALAIAAALPTATVVGLDISERAVAVARRNARSLGIQNVAFRRSDGLSRLPRRWRGRVDVMTAHPPYVPRHEVADLPPEVKEHEPRHTLTDGSVDGLGLVRALAAAAPDWLRSGGWLLLEVSPDRSRQAATVLRRAGLVGVRSLRPSLPVTRIVVGRRP